MESSSRIDSVLRESVDAGEVAGVVAAAADFDGPVYAGGFGKRSLGEAASMTPDTVFWIASMTKAITSVAAMQLVEQGKLQLDAPASDFAPDLGSAAVLEGFDSSGAPQTRPPKRPVTLRQLLTHTAGFGYDMWSEALVRYQETLGIPGIAACENVTLTTPLLFDPGERWEYGINIDWVGKLVEAVSGKNLQDYLREHILEPLAMRDTSFTLTQSQRTRLAGMHARLPDGSLQSIPFELNQAPEFFMGGGGLYSTAEDYLKFLQIFLHQGSFGGAEILRPETVELMLQNHIGDIAIEFMKSAIPAVTNDVDFFGQGQKWGLGFMLHTAVPGGGRGVGSATWAGLANTYYWIDPAAKLCGVILTQLLPFADPATLALYERFEKSVYEAIKAPV